jgi:ribosomal protein S18 acetylase RimI-like enzyme
MLVREARKDEYSIIQIQRVLAYEEYAEHLPPGHWTALKKSISAEIEPSAGIEVFIAEFNGEILGSVALFPPNADSYKGRVDLQDYPEIRMLAILPHARNKGAASLLIEECIKRSKTRNSKYVGLHTGEFMVNAMNLYEKLGFERVPELDFIPADDGIVVKGYRYEIKY